MLLSKKLIDYHNKYISHTLINIHMDYTTKKYHELKQILKDRGLDSYGKKADLVQRLLDHDAEQEEKDKKFKVTIKTLIGSFYTIHIEPTDTILELKKKIEDKHGCPTDKQILYYLCQDQEPGDGDQVYADGTIGKRIYDENKTLESCGIVNNSFFYLRIKLL